MLAYSSAGIKCRRCGDEAATCACNDCDRPLCDGCSEDEVCGQVLCVLCGGPINKDWDNDFGDLGGGSHARCE